MDGIFCSPSDVVERFSSPGGGGGGGLLWGDDCWGKLPGIGGGPRLARFSDGDLDTVASWVGDLEGGSGASGSSCKGIP